MITLVSLQPLLMLALEKFFESEDPQILEDLFYSINYMDCNQMPRLSIAERSILRSSDDISLFDEKFAEMENYSYYRGTLKRESDGEDSTLLHDRHFFDTRIFFDDLEFPIRIPLVIFPEEIGDVRYFI